MNQYSWAEIPGSDYLRSRSCKFVGSQLLVVGGYQPGMPLEKARPVVKNSQESSMTMTSLSLIQILGSWFIPDMKHRLSAKLHWAW